MFISCKVWFLLQNKKFQFVPGSNPSQIMVVCKLLVYFLFSSQKFIFLFKQLFSQNFAVHKLYIHLHVSGHLSSIWKTFLNHQECNWVKSLSVNFILSKWNGICEPDPWPTCSLFSFQGFIKKQQWHFLCS